MKLQFPVLALLMAFTFSACQKELSYEVDPGNTAGVGGGGGGNGGGGSSGGYYIKGKKDGAAFTFSTNALATVVDLSALGAPGAGLGMQASAGGSSLETFSISISVASGNTVPTGTYSESNNGGFAQIVTGIYLVSTTTSYVAGVNPSPAVPFKVVIQTKTSSEVSGTFGGTLYKSDASGNVSTDYITITEGSFNLPLK